MKYRRLTAIELKHLEKEFVQFLAANTITADDWVKLKQDKPEIAEELIEIFSDKVLDRAFEKIEYADKFSKNEVALYRFGKDTVTQIIIKSESGDPAIGSFQELQASFSNSDTRKKLTLYRAEKKFGNRKNEIFGYIESGGAPSKGELFRHFTEIIEI